MRYGFSDLVGLFARLVLAVVPDGLGELLVYAGPTLQEQQWRKVHI